jgi:hypothetical protein
VFNLKMLTFYVLLFLAVGLFLLVLLGTPRESFWDDPGMLGCVAMTTNCVHGMHFIDQLIARRMGIRCRRCWPNTSHISYQQDREKYVQVRVLNHRLP